MTREQLSELKRNFIDERQLSLKKSFTSAEKRLYETIFDKIVNSFDVEDGLVASTSKNLNKTAELIAIQINYFAKVVTEFTN